MGRAYHGRVSVHRRPLSTCVLERSNLGVQRRRRLLKSLIVRTPEDHCVGCVGQAVVDERCADRDAAFLIALARLREGGCKSELVDVGRGWGHFGEGGRTRKVLDENSLSE